MELMATGGWAYPKATVVETEMGFRVAMTGKAIRVAPVDVLVPESPEDPWFTEPQPTRTAPLAEIVDHLRRTPSDASEAAEHLAEHVRRFGAPDLCRHGLPPFHRWRTSGRTKEEVAAGRCASGYIDIRPVVDFVTAADVVLDAYDASLSQSKRWVPSQRDLRDVLSWPLFEGDFRKVVRGEYDRDGGLSKGRARQVADLWLTLLLDASGVRPIVASRRHIGPGLVLATETVVGMYAVEFARLAGVDPVGVENACLACGKAILGSGLYCSGAGPCQRERNRRKAANERRRKATKGASNV